MQTTATAAPTTTPLEDLEAAVRRFIAESEPLAVIATLVLENANGIHLRSIPLVGDDAE